MHYDSMRYRLIVALNETSDDILKMATTQSQKCFTKFIRERIVANVFCIHVSKLSHILEYESN